MLFVVSHMHTNQNYLFMKKKISSIFSVLLLAALLFSVNTLSAAKKTADWVLLKSEKNVSVYALQSNCEGRDVIILKVVNENADEVTLSWTLWGESSAKTLKINPKDVTQGGCESTARKALNDYVPEGKTFDSLKAEITIL